MVDPKNVIHLLYNVLMENRERKVMVFFNNVRTITFVANLFRMAGIETMQLHSNVNNPKKARNAFKDAKKDFLFTSNLASFGMDFPHVDLVVQFGHVNRTNFIQRLGRTWLEGVGKVY